MLKILLADIMLIVDLKICGTKWIVLDCFYVIDIEVWPFCMINNWICFCLCFTVVIFVPWVISHKKKRVGLYLSLNLSYHLKNIQKICEKYHLSILWFFGRNSSDAALNTKLSINQSVIASVALFLFVYVPVFGLNSLFLCGCSSIRHLVFVCLSVEISLLLRSFIINIWLKYWQYSN